MIERTQILSPISWPLLLQTLLRNIFNLLHHKALNSHQSIVFSQRCPQSGSCCPGYLLLAVGFVLVQHVVLSDINLILPFFGLKKSRN